jgi:hypothetical protein
MLRIDAGTEAELHYMVSVTFIGGCAQQQRGHDA